MLLEQFEKELVGLRASNDTLIRPVIEADVEALKRYGVTGQSEKEGTATH
jgi:hypothetical protein